MNNQPPLQQPLFTYNTIHLCLVRDRFYQRRARAIEGRLRALTGMIEGVRWVNGVGADVVGRLLKRKTDPNEMIYIHNA